MNNKGWNGHLLQLGLEVERSGPPHLYAAQRERRTLGIVFAELVDEFLEAARVLRFKLLSAGARAVDRGKFPCALGFPTFCDDLHLFSELGGPVRLCTHACCADGQ